MASFKVAVSVVIMFGFADAIVDLLREPEVFVGQSARVVRGQDERDFVVANQNIGMMFVALRQFGHAIDENHRVAEVAELPGAADLLVFVVPQRNVSQRAVDFFG